MWSEIDFEGIRRRYLRQVTQVSNTEVNATVTPTRLSGKILTTLPTTLITDKTYTFNISGVTTNRGAVNFKITALANELNLLFSKTEGILPYEDITVTVPNTVTADDEFIYTIEAQSTPEASFNGPLTLDQHIDFVDTNTLPTIEDLNWTLLTNQFETGKLIPFSITGGTDADGDTITYQIETIGGLVSFSKLKDIKSADIITMTIGNTPGTADVRIYAVDSKGELSETYKTYSIIIVNANRAPDASTISWNALPQYNEEGSYSVSFNGGTDPEGGTGLTYEIVQTTPFALVNFSKTSGIKPTDTVTMIVGSVTKDETAAITVRCVDAGGLSSTNTKVLTVLIKNKTTTNNPPVNTNVLITAPATMNEGTTGTMVITGGSDPEGDTITYRVASSDSKLTFSKTSGITSGENITLTVGDLTTDVPVTISVFVVDSQGNESAAKTVGIALKYINTAPVMTAFKSQLLPATVNEKTQQTVMFTGAVDSENHSFTYSINPPPELTFSKTSGITEGEIITVSVGSVSATKTISYQVYAKDSNNAISELKTINVTINNINTTPEGSSITWNGGLTINENTSKAVSFNGAIDADGDAIFYDILDIVNGTNLQFSKTTNISEGENITITAGNVSTDTVVTFNVQAKDLSGLTTTKKPFNITVKNVNTAPSSSGITWTGPSNINQNTSVTVSFSGATDPEGDAVTYKLNLIPPELTFSKTSGITAGESVTLTSGTISATGTVSFSVIPVDSSGLEGTAKSLSIIVNKPNTAPSAGGMQWNGPSTMNENSSQSVYFYGATDSETNQASLIYSISNISGPISFSRTSGLTFYEAVTLTANSVSSSQSASFRVTVTDGGGLTASRDFSFTVANVNTAPSTAGLNWNGPSSINENTSQSVYFYGAVDAEGDSISYSISNISGPISFSQTSGIGNYSSITFSAGAVTSTTSASFMVTVTDSNGASNSKTFSVSILDVQTVSINNLFIRAGNTVVSGLSVGYVYSPIWVDVKSDYKGVIGLDITATDGREYVTLERTNTTIDNTNGNGGSFLINKFHVPRTHNVTFVTIVVTPYITTSGGSRIYGNSNSVSVYFNKENTDIGTYLSLSYQFYLSDGTQLIKTITKTGTSAVGDLSTLPKNTWITINPTNNGSGIGGMLQTVRASGNCILRIRNPSFGINYVLDSSADSYSKAIGLFDTFGTYVEFYSTGTGILTFGLTEQTYGKCGAEAQFIF